MNTPLINIDVGSVVKAEINAAANDTKPVYRLGSQGLNRITQGGIRRGQATAVVGLHHQYRTRRLLSALMDIQLFNTPVVLNGEEGKTPVVLHVSFKESLTSNLQFYYQYLKGCDGEEVALGGAISPITPEMCQYTHDKLSETGFEMKCVQAFRSEFSFAALNNKISVLEITGHAVHVLAIDDFELMSTEGYLGTRVWEGVHDLFSRIKRLCAAKNIAFITTLRIHDRFERELRTLDSRVNFASDSADVGHMYAEAPYIGALVDLEIYQHVVTYKDSKYLTVCRGKHNDVPFLEASQRHFAVEFPAGGKPVLPDLHKEDTSLESIPI